MWNPSAGGSHLHRTRAQYEHCGYAECQREPLEVGEQHLPPPASTVGRVHRQTAYLGVTLAVYFKHSQRHYGTLPMEPLRQGSRGMTFR